MDDISQKDIIEKLRDAEEAVKIGEAEKEEVGYGDAGIPAGRLVSTADHIYIYDTKTGDCSKANRNMLAQLLKRKRLDGSFVFSTAPPRDKDGKIIKPKQGTYKCMLHKDAPNRKHYDELGFRVCPKSNLTSPFQVKQHMRRRHKQEWAAIEDEQKMAEGARERQLRETLLEKALKPEEPPLYVKDEKK